MANSELSKLKILFIYDYFRKHVSAFDEDNSVSVGDIISYLEDKLGYEFERKSIYADISRINEYLAKAGEESVSDSWITVEGRRYRKNQLKNEITIDEARLLVDAINTTDFVDTELCNKIRDLFPAYFDDNFRVRALYPHDAKISRRNVMWLNNIRTAIENRQSLSITYGYRLGNELTEKTDKLISPMALDWDNNCYYLIAIDNAAAKSIEDDKNLATALRRYRLDRMAQVSFARGDEKYIDFPTPKARAAALKNFMDNSVSAFTGDEAIELPLTIKGKSRKDILRAYNAFVTKIGRMPKIDDSKLESGELKLMFVTADVPTLYTCLFELTTFEGITCDIGSEQVRHRFESYLKRACKGL